MKPNCLALFWFACTVPPSCPCSAAYSLGLWGWEGHGGIKYCYPLGVSWMLNEILQEQCLAWYLVYSKCSVNIYGPWPSILILPITRDPTQRLPKKSFKKISPSSKLPQCSIYLYCSDSTLFLIFHWLMVYILNLSVQTWSLGGQGPSLYCWLWLYTCGWQMTIIGWMKSFHGQVSGSTACLAALAKSADNASGTGNISLVAFTTFLKIHCLHQMLQKQY